MAWELLQGDCLEVLRTLPDESVHCCVTSPPYWGLRDYGVNGQMGLEATPEEYVAKMVEVFREVKRVLKKDGTLFLNLGDSYYGSGKGRNADGTHSEGGKQAMNKGSVHGELFKTASDVQHVSAYDIYGRVPKGYQENGCLCENLCDVCREVYLRTSHTYDLLVPMLIASLSLPNHECTEFASGHFPTSDLGRLGVRIFPAIQVLMHSPIRANELLPSFRESMPDEFSRQLLDVCWQRGNSSACLLCGRSLTDNAQASSRMLVDSLKQSWRNQNNGQHDGQQGRHNLCKDTACEYCNGYKTLDAPPYIQPYCTINQGERQLKPKDLVGIPWMVAFALRADGWYLRSDIIWCLSGGAWLYTRTQKGDMPMMVRDIARLDLKTIKLWNGEKWTQLLGMSKSERKGNELELVLRSGERISCTPTHKFPTDKGLKEARDIEIGDILQTCQLPEPEQFKDCAIGEDAAWLAGLYIAEGSMAGDTIQISGHAKENERWERLQEIANKYGGYITRTIDGNKMDIRLYGKILVAIIAELVSGKTAKDKCFAPVVWRYSNKFIESMLDGYLSGDGHYDKGNNRWRLGFTRNYNLERDLRTACARLGYRLTINSTTVLYNGKQLPTFRGEIRKTRSGHFNEKDMGEVVEIRKARCRYVYDLGVKDEPHVFALASGVLTHNSKPNPMPESVTDRPTKAHEYIFLMAKSERYYYDHEAVKEPATHSSIKRWEQDLENQKGSTRANGGAKTNGPMKAVGGPKKDKQRGHSRRHAGFNERWDHMSKEEQCSMRRNKRTVWTVAPQPFPEAHFATFPPKLIVPCILAGCPEGGTVLDPFVGSGTTLWVAEQLGVNSIGIELNPDYCEIIRRRMNSIHPNLFEGATI